MGGKERETGGGSCRGHARQTPFNPSHMRAPTTENLLFSLDLSLKSATHPAFFSSVV